MSEPKHTITMAIKVDRAEFDAFADRVEHVADRMRSMGPKEIGSRLAWTVVAALAAGMFIAGYFIEQRTEQACLVAGNPPEVCRTTLGDHF